MPGEIFPARQPEPPPRLSRDRATSGTSAVLRPVISPILLGQGPSGVVPAGSARPALPPQVDLEDGHKLCPEKSSPQGSRSRPLG